MIGILLNLLEGLGQEAWLAGWPVILAAALSAACILAPAAKAARSRRKIKKLAREAEEFTPEEFFQLRRQKGRGKQYLSTRYDFAGVYILFNRTKNMYYVGQSINVFRRVNNHFTGHGNGDIYADYKYGDLFAIRMIPLKGSGFANLDSLERDAISTYRAYYKGYNRNRGNKS